MKSGLAAFALILLFPALAQAKQSFLPKGFCPGMIDYTYYSLCYDPEHRQAAWVKHKLTRELIGGKQKRTDDFRADIDNLEDPVLASDYKGSGYDRGHMLPAADMKLSYQSMSETFFMTNMSPQNSRFNRGIWARIERRMRRLVKKYGTAHVVTAPVLEMDLPKIETGVSVPRWYYKVAYFPGPQIMKAFLIANEAPPSGAWYQDYMVTIDEVEEFTGYDFFSELPDWLEYELEAQIFRE